MVAMQLHYSSPQLTLACQRVMINGRGTKDIGKSSSSLPCSSSPSVWYGSHLRCVDAAGLACNPVVRHPSEAGSTSTTYLVKTHRTALACLFPAFAGNDSTACESQHISDR